MGIPAGTKLTAAVIGSAGDRPIGMTDDGHGNYVFTPYIFALTEAAASEVAKNDSGRGAGVTAIPYKDASALRGHYSVYVRVEKITSQDPFPDGTVARERSSAGVYVIVGGAKLWISDPTELSYFAPRMWQDVTVVPDGALTNLPTVPRERTVLRERTSAPVYVMIEGKKCWIADPVKLQQYGGWSVVRLAPRGSLTNIPTGPNAP
jgi:hypothetical protein